MNPIRSIKFAEKAQAVQYRSRWNWGFIGCGAFSLFVWGIIGAILWAIWGAK